MLQETKSTETFNQRVNIIVAVVVAVIAVLGSLITNLENEASTEANRASIAEQQYYYQSIGKQISGQADVDYAFGTVYQLWYQYEVQILSSQKRGEAESIKTFTELKDAVARTSPLFDPQYFDATTGKINLPLYEANVYRRELYELEEKQLAANEVASAWGDKSSTYVLQLTLLAVAGFLLGLAVITKAKIPTLVFATSGVLLVVVISVWAYQVYLIPVTERSEEAMVLFAEGASLRDQQLWNVSLEKLNAAIGKAGTEDTYSRAYLLRAQVQTKIGNFSEAISDYHVAIESGFIDDPTVDASLVQAYFNIGDFNNAIKTGNNAIKNSPDNLGLRQQVNMAILASGYTIDATKQVAILIEQATQKVNFQRQAGDNDSTAETWWLLNDAAHQYEQLVELLENKAAESPVKENINDPITIGKKAKELAEQLRTTAIALKYDLPNDPTASNDPGTSSSPAKIEIKQITPSLTPDDVYVYKVDMEFVYSGIEVGQLLSIVTYRDGIEEPSWNFSSTWTDPQAEGIATYTLSPSYSSLYIVSPGFYTVSIYLNGNPLAQSAFTVDDPNAQADNNVEGDFVFDEMLDQFDPYAGNPVNFDDDYYYYSYDPFFFYGDENDYLYFLEDSYNYYTNYCTDPNDLNCFTSSDSDGDGISDEYDYCIFDPGPTEHNGCPASSDDIDGDGILNDTDVCISEPGPEENNGCPFDDSASVNDYDGDGIFDDIDACVFDPGTEENYGCPLANANDSDGDGIFDDMDACPFDPGTEENNGCPVSELDPSIDWDGDGIADDNDDCPYSPGPESNLGCPAPEPESPDDSDGDGIADINDDCPYSSGPESNFGCPVQEPEPPADWDGDGILDDHDGCPYSPGPESNNGCPVQEPEPPNPPDDPDSDGDGLPDSIDPCPSEPGENDGCPVEGYKILEFGWVSLRSRFGEED